MCDNIKLDIRLGMYHLKDAFSFACRATFAKPPPVAYEDSPQGLIFFWLVDKNRKDCKPIPDLVTPEQLVENWLKKHTPEEFQLDEDEKYADLDGSCKVGFRIWVEEWGHVNHSPYAMFAIKPVWCWFSK